VHVCVHVLLSELMWVWMFVFVFWGRWVSAYVCMCVFVFLLVCVCVCAYVCVKVGSAGKVQTRVVQFDFLRAKFVKVLEPSNCSSSSMCDFENGGFCWFLRSYSSKTCLNCYKYIKYTIFNPYTKNLNVWRPSKAFSCIFVYNFGPQNSKKGLKVRWTFNSSRTACLGFVIVRESSRTRTFDRTPNWTTLVQTRAHSTWG
jgi:hypothetical protein